MHTPKGEYRIPIVDAINGFIQTVAKFTAWANVVLIGIILVQVVLRYGFNRGLVPLEELMWHLYAVAFMFGLAYAVTTDSHIRVDLVHMRLPLRLQHWFEIIGILFLMMPFIVIIFHHSLEWVAYSFELNESSSSPTGLPYRWIIKSVLPISFALLFLAAVARLIREIVLLRHRQWDGVEEHPGRVSALRRLFRVESEVK